MFNYGEFATIFINDGLKQSERLEKLNQIAIQQMRVLEENTDGKLLTDAVD